MARNAEVLDRSRWSAGLTLSLLLPLSGCCALLDIETYEVEELRVELIGTEGSQFMNLEQTGEVVAGFLERVEIDEFVRYKKRNRRIPTMYADRQFGGRIRFPADELSCVYWLLDRPKPVEWEEREGEFRRDEGTGVTRQRASPSIASGVEWELGLADRPVSGLVETDADGRFTISFEQNWGAVRSSLDRMVSADLRLEDVDGGAVVVVPIDLLRVDDAIMRNAQ